MDCIFFNRVTKVGSESLVTLMERLGNVHGYKVIREPKLPFIPMFENNEQQNEIADRVLQENQVYFQHVNYINFDKLNRPRPIYINLVRHPVDRIISWFYYRRAPWLVVIRKRKYPDEDLPDVAWLRKNFEDCVLTGDPECTFEQDSVKHDGDHRRQLLYYCGQNQTACLPFNSLSALQRAKEHVERNYAVVGNWKYTNITLDVLEHYIPKYFKGAKDIYHSHPIETNSNSFKPPIDEVIKDILRKNFTREIEFYEFCNQRLYKQYFAIHLGKSTEYIDLH